MNLFKIEFIQGKTDEPDYGQVKHSLIDGAKQRAIISLSISADKLQSVSNYSREPKRLVFECFLTDWIRDHILSGDYEHERYVSHYEVKAYRDGVLFFSGIIDTSQLSYDVSTDIIKLTCYDKIKLLSVYSDLAGWYSLLAGYEPWMLLERFLANIRLKIPISTPFSIQFTLPTCNKMLTITTVDYADMLTLPIPTASYTCSIHENTWLQPVFGFRFDLNNLYFIFYHKVIIHADYGTGGPGLYQCRLRGRIHKYFNGFCPVTKEYDYKSSWSDLEDVDKTDGLMEFFSELRIPKYGLENLVSGGVVNGRAYGSAHWVNQQVYATFSGNIYPSRLMPGKAYENATRSEHTNRLKALQAMLMLYNATIFSDPTGRIIFKNKDAYSATIIEIEDRDVVSFTTKRGNQEEPKTSEINILAGDTTQLQEIIKERLMDFYDSRWSIDATIDQLAKYNLSLQDKIRIQDHVYAITELNKDYEKDEYKVKAWRLT